MKSSFSFQKSVVEPFGILNAILLNLPLPDHQEAAALLSGFLPYCLKFLKEGMTPEEIVDQYLNQSSRTWTHETKKNLLIGLHDLISKQERILEAIEASVFEEVYEEHARGRLHFLLNSIRSPQKAAESLQRVQCTLLFPCKTVREFPILESLPLIDLRSIRSDLWRLARTPIQEEGSIFQVIEQIFDSVLPVVLQIHQTLSDEFLREYLRNSEVSLPLHIAILIDADSTSEAIRYIHEKTIDRYVEEIDHLAQLYTTQSLKEVLEEIKGRLLGSVPYQSPHEFYLEVVGLRDLVEQQERGIQIDSIDRILCMIRTMKFQSIQLELEYKSIFSRIIEKNPEYNLYSSLSTEQQLTSLRELHQRPPLNLGLNREPFLQSYHMDCENGLKDILEILYLFRCSGWHSKEVPVDFNCTFSTKESIEKMIPFLESLWIEPVYAKHLRERGREQYLIFDFTTLQNNCGLFTALWTIDEAVRDSLAWSKKNGITLHFGSIGHSPQMMNGSIPYQYGKIRGNTEDKVLLPLKGEKQIRHLIEQLLCCLWEQKLFPHEFDTSSTEDQNLLKELAEKSCNTYRQLIQSEHFTEFSHMQLSGFFGIGTALQTQIDRSNTPELQAMCRHSPLFRLLLSYCVLSLDQSLPLLTTHLQKHKDYKEIWQQIAEEHQLTRNVIRMISQGAPSFPIDLFATQMLDLKEPQTLSKEIIAKTLEFR